VHFRAMTNGAIRAHTQAAIPHAVCRPAIAVMWLTKKTSKSAEVIVEFVILQMPSSSEQGQPACDAAKSVVALNY